MTSRFLKSFSILLLFLGQLLLAQSGYKIPEKPAVLYPVYDAANLLTKEERDALNNKLISFADSTSTEIEVIILPNSGGEDVNFLATMYGEKWEIGQKGVDNGVVFLIAVDDHTMAIQQGRAVEKYLTASVAGQILDYLVTPSFRQGNWYEGIDRGTNAVMEAVQGKFKPIKKQQKEEPGFGRFFMLFFIVIVIIIIMSKGGGGGGGRRDDVTLGRGGRSIYPGGFFPFPGSFGGGRGSGGFGGGGFGGGGFGGFGGGGSFGGGGASGGW